MPSVTTVIGQNLGWDKEMLLGWTRKMMREGKDPILFRDRAGAFGTVVHKFVELGRVDSVGLDLKVLSLLSQDWLDKAKGAFDRYAEWAKQHWVEPLAAELPLVSEEYKYGGTLDMVANVDGVPSLLDVKTSSRIKTSHRVQVSAYKHLYHEVHGVWLQPVLLHLPGRDSDEPLEPYPMGPLVAEWDAFLHLLALYQLKKVLDPFEREDR